MLIYEERLDSHGNYQSTGKIAYTYKSHYNKRPCSELNNYYMNVGTNEISKVLEILFDYQIIGDKLDKSCFIGVDNIKKTIQFESFESYPSLFSIEACVQKDFFHHYKDLS